MAEEAVEQEGEFREPGEDPGEKNYLVLLLVILNTVFLGAVAFLQFQALQRDSKKETVQDIVKAELAAQNEIEEAQEVNPTQQKQESGILYNLEPFTANLAQGDGPQRYVRMSIVLKFSNDSEKKEFEARKPQMRDAIISLLNSKRPEDLLRTEGKQYLKEEIKSSINTFLINGNVIDVFYVGFQVQ